MKVSCAWCHKKMGEKEPLDDPAESHGICRACFSKQQRQLKKLAIREAGRATEEQFFGKKGIVTHAQALKAAEKLVEHERAGAKLNPLRKSKPQWVYDMVMRSYILDLDASGAYVIRPTGSGFRTSLVTGDTTRPISDSTEIEDAMDEIDRIQGKKFKRPKGIYGSTRLNPLAVFSVANPGRKHGKFRSCVRKVSKSLRARGRAGDPARICGAALNNPPNSIHARVEGVIYNRCIEIRAEKTVYKPGLYKHPFSRKSRVQVLALDNGDILIHSQAGTKLWGED